MPRPYHTQRALSQRSPHSSPSSPSCTASSHAALEPSGDPDVHPGPATQVSPDSALASNQPLGVVSTPGRGPRSVLDEMRSFLLPDDCQAEASITPQRPGTCAPVTRPPHVPEQARPALPRRLSAGWGNAKPGVCRLFPCLMGAAWGKNYAGVPGTPNGPQCGGFPGLCPWQPPTLAA